ncbi:MAG: hypothetical protein JF609_05440, partial [Verrucomicrobia bacterium]|nr:hypothetical protein [Verrucomicrobiota bacterium]
GNNATNNNSGAFFTFIGVATPTVLLVDAYDTAAEENNGATVIPDGSYTNVLAAAGITFGFWKVTQRNSPSLADLKPYPVVIWRLTDDTVNYGADADGFPDPTATNNTLNAQQQFVIQTYLNGGGSFFMSSMGILSQLGDVPFRHNVLQVAGFVSNPDALSSCDDCDEDFGVEGIVGESGSVASGINLTLNYSNYPSFDFDEFSFGPDFSDTFTPSSLSTPITFETNAFKPCGMSYPNVGVDSPGRVVFLSFPFDTVPTNGTGTNNAVALLRKIMQFLTPGLNGVGLVQFDSSIYTTNEVVTVQVADSDLAGAGQTTVAFGASSRTNRTTVTLFETTHPGLFTGYLTLVPGVAVTNQLRVTNNDIITATYFDVSNGSNVTATAAIDTISPVISQVAAISDVANALVTWKTSKPADSSVQYSESPLPDRVAYSSQLVTNHALVISGLAANRVYYYQVVSRDQAGNITVDDNNGNLYSFQTLKAPTPPWSDDLEGDTHGWSVIPYSGSTIVWTLGKPNNSLQHSAFSGTNAWCSNINGQSPGFFAGSFLYSPLIDLSGVSQATLTFWTSFDFTSGLDDGELGISTNTATAPIDVATLVSYSGDASLGWEQETVDISQFVGQTIQVVWFFVGFDTGSWMVDDVSITGMPAGGNIQITKNLGQGTWSLSSVSSIGLVPVQSGVTPSITISNLTAGQYAVQFGDVPYYQTPPDQTNTLVVGTNLTFTGTYGFIDVNSNGIPDSWERDYFGVATTNRTQKTDSDHDGMTDYAEFIAGTNPTNAASRFYFTGETIASNRLVHLQWPVVTNRLYQVNASTNFTSWQPVTTWWQASNNPTMIYTATNIGRASFYRVQVQP